MARIASESAMIRFCEPAYTLPERHVSPTAKTRMYDIAAKANPVTHVNRNFMCDQVIEVPA